MGDIYVHEKLPKCCQKTLAELDEKKKAAKMATGLMAVGSLVTMLGGSPVDVALGMVADLAGKKGGEKLSGSRTSVDEIEDPAARASDIDVLLRSTCAKICMLHALDHTGTEARFWAKMADNLSE